MEYGDGRKYGPYKFYGPSPYLASLFPTPSFKFAYNDEDIEEADKVLKIVKRY